MVKLNRTTNIKEILGTNKHIDKNIRIKLKKRIEKQIKKSITQIAFDRYFSKKYAIYRKQAKLIILQSQKMIRNINQNPKLKTAQLLFIDRDAIPFMQTMKILEQKQGNNEHIFGNVLFSDKLFKDYIKFVGIASIIKQKSPGIQLISKYIEQLENAPEFKEYKTQKTIKNIDPSKPIIIIDSGIVGSHLKINEAMLNYIFPNTKIYTGLFYHNRLSKNTVDFTIAENKVNTVFKQFAIKQAELEKIPKFENKLESIKNGETIRTNKREPQNPISAKIFAIALGNELLKYTK